MLKNKILIKITGSIAAYKVGYLISKLVQNNFEIKTVVSESALNFIGKATLEGLSRNPVYTDTFDDGKMMSHIDLVKWADLTILVPADANTINKFSSGIAGNLITTLFLARDNKKPYLIAPAMNTAMYDHPATQNSLVVLKKWGIKILPTIEGYLACGDTGRGKLLEPDEIFAQIKANLESFNAVKKVLITSGATQEKIDNVRFISNLSTGRTGSAISEYLSNNGFEVTFLKSFGSAASPSSNTIEYSDLSSLKNLIKSELQNNKYDTVIHLAAVSDYSPVAIEYENGEAELPLTSKLSSEADSLSIKFKKNTKIIDHIKEWSYNKNIKLVGFKLLDKKDEFEFSNTIGSMFKRSKADRIVFNSLDRRIENDQKGFEVYSSIEKHISAADVTELAVILKNYIMED